ncbi:signal peptidase I [Candidatus Woesebacteria bacterium RIFOXYC1_FULL_41_14]|uniref:Signal peptidase I n=4 Tax=Candidatus Woeseibacteriota TaxID=1752722 RepID=A0A0G0U5N9_9BACT|nr:MAG: Signal peptidase I [Candidatus Woesebacteria bacterium GW2011_GWF1_40_24]KKR89586.1 MAG: Signal peptidase I [Candidatus Woesebacteria bacterium GW2011_GWD1_41_12]OGM81055.1 MAG: signal peptidase I [Candidatus Woesebacteria bacterium RIFOXYB1_FULL_41_13]OGM84414.1 MAG: signal peptidase I [Candidatus Woesebacteria bacterium RIFOXYC1_FULL_41_14]OGM88695.1 MAG: signal peptidase I [Candidatus Woesebacteria bacterium RIFOXYD1_FULL_41_28]
MIKRLGAFFLDVFEVVVFAIGIFFFVYLLIMRPHKIDGQSMMPNFPDNEYLLTEKVSYYLKNPARGDVVVFTPPITNLDEYIKRVIALPGETVAIENGHVYINGELLGEPYLEDTLKTNGGAFLQEGQEYVVPENQYFVMGDNRPNSSDSRYWGPISKKSISGRAWVIYWPLNLTGGVPKPSYTFAE